MPNRPIFLPASPPLKMKWPGLRLSATSVAQSPTGRAAPSVRPKRTSQNCVARAIPKSTNSYAPPRLSTTSQSLYIFSWEYFAVLGFNTAKTFFILLLLEPNAPSHPKIAANIC